MQAIKMTNQSTETKLFCVCPDCFLEQPIRRQFGENVLFLTALGAVFHFDDNGYADAIVELIQREHINELFIVANPSCRFIASTVNNETNSGTPAERTIVNLYRENEATIRRDHRTVAEQQERLAVLNAQRQAIDLMAHPAFGTIIKQQPVSVKNLLYHKPNRFTSEPLHAPKPTTHEY